jgi:chemotaxis protein MotB
MARVKKYLDTRQSDNQERWLVSYADFITLLFAFFVVMYAVSSVNEAKYRVLSEAIGSAFGTRERQQPLPPEAGAPPGVATAEPASPAFQGAVRRAAIEKRQREEMRDIAREINSELATLVAHGDVRVIQSPRGVTVEINASVLFAPGQAILREEPRKLLRALAGVLKAGGHALQIEGHTDDTAISNVQFPSNWELSAARASSVVRLFAESGVAPQRLAALGYGEYRPLDTNATAAGRARNRRVTLTVLAHEPDGPTEIPLSAAPAGAPGRLSHDEQSLRPQRGQTK